jgi:hypothetical protein
MGAVTPIAAAGSKQRKAAVSAILTTAHYSVMERLIESAWKTDGTAIWRRFWDNFRQPLTVKLVKL